MSDSTTNTLRPIIDPEFATLIPPLASAELELLEANILAEGCRDPLVVWEGILLDGHNRLSICEKHGIGYRVVERELPDRDAARAWILDNQMGRRNLTRDQFTVLLGMRYQSEKRTVGRPEKLPQNAGVIGETAERLATEYGVHKATVERAAATVDAIPPDDIAAVLQGEKRLRDVKPHVANNSGDNEWYTPEPYIAAARAVMDGIDLDPASCAAANAVVGATRYYTRENDGLSRLWSGRVWLNPPFATDLIGKFAEKMAAHYESGDVTEACVLVNNATETAWFARLIENASAVCFPRGRVRFWHPDKVSAPLQGQAVIYLGDNPDEFRRKFAEFGWTASL